MAELERFAHAQDDRQSGLEAALAEMRSGQKRSHWIWYVFPQLRGLGSSPMAAFYGIDGPQEAEAYLCHPLLRHRLLTAASIVLDQVRTGVSLTSLMGADLDALKLVSSMTLFGVVAGRLKDGEAAGECARLVTVAGQLLNAAAAEGFGRCAFTEQHLVAAGYELP